MRDRTLYCSACPCVYGSPRRVGQRCGDLSYLGSVHAPTTVKAAKALRCPGRLLSPHHPSRQGNRPAKRPA